MESMEHKEMKYKIKGIAQKFGYRCQVEMFSPLYMSFFTNMQKKYIDVWCEYSKSYNGSVWGRQIPIEIYCSENILLELDKIKNQFKINPKNSFRVVISKSIRQPYTITSKQSGKYFDMHLIPWGYLEPFIQILKVGKVSLIANFKPKIAGLVTYIAGIKYRQLSQDIWEQFNIGDEFILERENNKYDEFAIKVIYNNEHIGYIPKDYSKDVAPKIDDGLNYVCVLESKFGSLDDKPILNIRLIEG